MTQTVILECSNGKKLKRNPSDCSSAMMNETRKCFNGKKLKRNPSDCSSAMMNKTHKFSKGQSSSFIPDYIHAAETLGETEGYGSFGRADSEASCTPKRKRLSLNAEHNCRFNIPVQVITPSMMSCSERKDIETRLRGELEKVQLLQMEILSGIPAAASGLAFSSSSDGHARKEDLKRDISGGFELKKQAPPPPTPPPTNSVALVMKQCETLLKNLMQHKYSWVFKTPVDVVKLRIPDYFNIIKHPMDLGTVKKKLASGSYSNPSAFASDVRLTFTNAMTYNPPGNDVHIMADTLNKMFEKRWKPIGEKLAAVEEIVKRDKYTVKSEPLSMPTKRKDPPTEKVVATSKSVKPKMPFDEKQELSNQLQAVLEDLPDHIINFLKQQSHNANSSVDEDEIEIDIESLNDDTLFELRKLLDDYFGVKQPVPQVQVKPSEMEMLVESGVSNTLMPCQVNEPADEDVDIGGDDPPILSYPPLEIEKDTAPRSTKHSSSSSSSSDSGSSSDSDSGSSSTSESDAKSIIPTKSLKENEQPEVARGLEKCDIKASADSTRTLSGPDHGHDVRLQPASFEEEDCQDGENGTSKRRVSPDKLYRAAVLKNRFADTILKAREKTLSQGEKKDPEKLRREREELERQKRKEKARLQSEAKAAEDARRQEVAAEAKRKRELEREAARQALLQMEKTVEIDENSLFLKDLEILGTAPCEHIASTVHGMSPDHLQGLGGFNLVGGSNPLERLGLYRKDDDEDEEECGPTSLFKIDDVEEGEID